MSARARATLRLTATSGTLSPPDALDTVATAAARVKGGGASLLTTGLQNLGAQVNVEQRQPGRLALSITSGRRIVELCTFAATAATDDSGQTTVTVGGLDTYRTTQSTALGFIPVGPKMIAGMAPYKRLLEEIERRLRAADAEARATIGERETIGD